MAICAHDRQSWLYTFVWTLAIWCSAIIITIIILQHACLVICWLQMPTGVPRTVFLTKPAFVSICSDSKVECFLSFTDKGKNSQVFLCRKGVLDTYIQPGMYYYLWDKGTHHVIGQKKPLVRSSDYLDRCLKTSTDSKFVSKWPYP